MMDEVILSIVATLIAIGGTGIMISNQIEELSKKVDSLLEQKKEAPTN